MKKRYLIAIMILLCSNAEAAGHNIYIPNVSNFARDIDPSTDFAILKDWVAVMQRQPITSSNKKPTYADILRINATCNAKSYKVNPSWPTPKEFEQSSSGDCKGFAICKYYALRKAGFKADQLNLWSGDYDGHSHMILVVSLNDKQYVMDVGAESNLPEAKNYFYKHFLPGFRFNENGWDVN